MSKVTRGRAIALAASGAAALTGFPAVVRAQASTIRIGASGAATQADGYFADQLGYFKQSGITATITTTLRGAETLAAVSRGDLDFASATPQGVARAFAKLDTIKPDIVWWQAGAQPPQLLASREVVMTTAWNGRIQNPIDHEHAPFKIVWANQMIEYDMISIPKGSPHLDLAYKYLAFVAQPENNARLGQFIPYGPVVKDATRYVPQDVLPKLPTAPDHMKDALPIDMEFWADYGQDLTKKFNDWLAK